MTAQNGNRCAFYGLNPTHKFEVISFRITKVIEQKPNAKQTKNNIKYRHLQLNLMLKTPMWR